MRKLLYSIIITLALQGCAFAKEEAPCKIEGVGGGVTVAVCPEYVSTIVAGKITVCTKGNDTHAPVCSTSKE